jgi:Tfp pilus assembly protein PilO
MSKREKWLLYGVMGVLAILLIDSYVLTPLLDEQETLQIEQNRILTDIKNNQKMLLDRKALMSKWSGMLSTGLKRDPADAEGQMLRALRDWAKDSGVSLSSFKTDRPESKETLKEVHVQATGNGNMEAISKLMFKMQSAQFPLKVTEFQLGSRNENTNELALQLKISTLFRAADAKVATAEKPAKGDAK